MEIAKIEMDALEQVGNSVVQKAEVIELADLQLAMVGGGVGDVILG